MTGATKVTSLKDWAQEASFGWVGPPEILGVAVNWLESKVREVDKVHRLKKFTLVTASYKTAWTWRVKVPMQKVVGGKRVVDRKWHEAHASFSDLTKYPCLLDLPSGSRQLPREERILGLIEGKGPQWEYVTTRVDVLNATEMAVLTGAMPLWTYLRKTGQVPGSATKPQAHRAAIEWLNEFRRWRKTHAQTTS